MRIKQGDLAVPFSFDLNADISGTTARFRLWKASSRISVIDAVATIDNPTEGKGHYDFTAGQTDTPGHYEAEVLVTFPGSKPQRYPGAGYAEIIIEPSIPVP